MVPAVQTNALPSDILYNGQWLALLSFSCLRQQISLSASNGTLTVNSRTRAIQLMDARPQKRSTSTRVHYRLYSRRTIPKVRFIFCLLLLVRHVSYSTKLNKACNSCYLPCCPCYSFLQGQSNLTSCGSCSHELQKSVGCFPLDYAARQSINKLLARTMFQCQIIHITSWWDAQLHWRLRKCCPVFLAQCRCS